MSRAAFWKPVENNRVRCGLCPHRCDIAEGSSGVCGVRENHEGVLIATGYGQVSSIALDPIEKKPLYNFHPGKTIVSIGGFGCNLRCPFCQNHAISLEYKDSRQQAQLMTPELVAEVAVLSVPDRNTGVAYTYNEPLISYEFIRDCAELVRREGLCNVLVTNGFINEEPMLELLPLIDAMNIDLKAFSGEFYKMVGGALEEVKRTIKLCRASCHVEITTLVIPGENENDIEDLSKWLASIDADIILHLSRYFPRYRYSDRAPASRECMFKAYETAGKYLNNVFIGNM